MPSSVTYQRAKSLRRSMSPTEARLWERLRAHRLHGYKFRRQHPFGIYILDFYCAAARLAIEIDGASHDEPAQIAHDRRRTAWLKTQGVRVIRLDATDVRDELEGVLAFIAWAVRERLAEIGETRARVRPAVPLPVRAGEVREAPRAWA